MPKEFIMRGQTAVGAPTEVLDMTGYRPGYGYAIKEFQIYPSTGIGTQAYEMAASITAATTAEAPDNPNFNNEGLIATTLISSLRHDADSTTRVLTVVNDLFVITQDVILMIHDDHNQPVNWQVRFKEVKLGAAAEAVANYKQYTIYNTSQ